MLAHGIPFEIRPFLLINLLPTPQPHFHQHLMGRPDVAASASGVPSSSLSTAATSVPGAGLRVREGN
jgi:hypothetical protein